MPAVVSGDVSMLRLLQHMEHVRMDGRGECQVLLYFYNQNDGHASHRFSANTANNFLLIYGDLGDLLEKSISGISSDLVVKVQ